MRCLAFRHWGYGATAARLTPDQKVGSSNLSALNFVNGVTYQYLPRICIALPKESSKLSATTNCSITLSKALTSLYDALRAENAR